MHTSKEEIGLLCPVLPCQCRNRARQVQEQARKMGARGKRNTVPMKDQLIQAAETLRQSSEEHSVTELFGWKMSYTKRADGVRGDLKVEGPDGEKVFSVPALKRKLESQISSSGSQAQPPAAKRPKTPTERRAVEKAVASGGKKKTEEEAPTADGEGGGEDEDDEEEAVEEEEVEDVEEAAEEGAGGEEAEPEEGAAEREEAVVEVENKAPHDDAAEAPQSLCANGHVLTSRMLRGAAGEPDTCDACSGALRRGATVYSCEACDYDKCEPCTSGACGGAGSSADAPADKQAARTASAKAPKTTARKGTREKDRDAGRAHTFTNGLPAPRKRYEQLVRDVSRAIEEREISQTEARTAPAPRRP